MDSGMGHYSYIALKVSKGLLGGHRFNVKENIILWNDKCASNELCVFMWRYE